MSPPDREVMMSVPDSTPAGFSEQVFLQILRQQTQTLERIDRSMETHNATNMQMVQRLTALEQRPSVAAELAIIKTEIDLLKKRNSEEDGAAKFLKFLKDYTPWLFALIIGGVAYFQKKAGA